MATVIWMHRERKWENLVTRCWQESRFTSAEYHSTIRGLVWRWVSIVDESLLSVSSNSACFCEIALWVWVAFTEHFILSWKVLLNGISVEPLWRRRTQVFYRLFIHLIWTVECLGRTLVSKHTLHQKVFFSFLQYYASCLDLLQGTQPETGMESVCLSKVFTPFVNIQYRFLFPSHIKYSDYLDLSSMCNHMVWKVWKDLNC